MKYFSILMLLALSTSVFASDCEEFGKKAVSCYEKGLLGSYYDETGDECGEGTDNIWEVVESQNPSIETRTIETREYGYMGGYAWESKCFVSFTNVEGQYCGFHMKTSFGTEDGDITTSEFFCK